MVNNCPCSFIRRHKLFLCYCYCLPDISSRPWQVQHIRLISVVIGVVLCSWLRNLYKQGFSSTKKSWDNLTACSKCNSVSLLHFTWFLEAALSHLLLHVISSIHPSVWGTILLWNTRLLRDQDRRIWNLGLSCLGRSFCAFPTNKLSTYIHLECFSFLYTKNGFSTVDEESEEECEFLLSLELTCLCD